MIRALLFSSLCALLLVHLGSSQLLYTNSGVIKFVTAFAIPISVDSPGRSMGMSAGIQALYLLPHNTSYFQPYKVLQKRSVTHHFNRKLVYQSLEPLFQRFGLPGKECLLRFICETAGRSFVSGQNSVLGRILHVVFTPLSEDVMDTEYMEAYRRGSRLHADCSQPYNCTMTSSKLFDFQNYV